MNQIESGKDYKVDNEQSRGVKGQASKAEDFIVTVILNSWGQVGDYYWNNIQLMVGDLCVVEEGEKSEFGKVSLSRRPYSSIRGRKKTLGKILRAANQIDKDQYSENLKREKMAMNYCRERISDLDLRMSLSRVQCQFDGRKAIFFFTAENRVDFRELVKDLANFTRIKVEMRQIGVRDEARMIGGCGPCGNELCCAKFLHDFNPVSIRMAKDQMLSLSPEKISGVCGRLMCCLAYEHATYKQLRKNFPKMGKQVDDPDGKRGKVCQMNILCGKIGLVYEDGGKKEFDISEFDGRPGITKPAAPAKETVQPKTMDAKTYGGRARPDGAGQTAAKETPREEIKSSSGQGDSAQKQSTGRSRRKRRGSRRKRPN